MSETPQTASLPSAGFTIFLANKETRIHQSTIDAIKQSGALWVRPQHHWHDIELAPGVFDFAPMDDTITKCNAAGLPVCLPLQDAPDFHKSIGIHNHPNLLAPPEAWLAYAEAVAKRYDGKTKSPINDKPMHIAAVQIGNEEYDMIARNALLLVPVVKLVAPMLRKALPDVLIGINAVRRTASAASQHIHEFMNALFAAGIGDLIDWCDFHCYTAGRRVGPDPLVGDADEPSALGELSIIQAVRAAHKANHVRIWCTETGWDTGGAHPVTPVQQSTYFHTMLTLFQEHNPEGVLMYYTIGDEVPNSTKSIKRALGSDPTEQPAYSMLQAFTKEHPTTTAPKKGGA